MGSAIYKPGVFQGNLSRHNYFEGWYFKQEDLAGRTLALIPGVSLSKSSSNEAFIQVLDGFEDRSYYIPFSVNQFSASKSKMQISIDQNTFHEQGFSVDIQHHNLRLQGTIIFDTLDPYPVTLRSPGIMGWYRYVPRMECFHAVLSMKHSISGYLSCNGNTYDFTRSSGYIEKDWGSSFPRDYIWLQCNTFEDEHTSFMLSIASIPWMGSEFTGFLAFLRTKEKLYRFATYTRARIHRLNGGDQSLQILIEDKNHSLTVVIQESEGKDLSAPYRGEMKRIIRESVISRLHLELKDRLGNHILSSDGFPAGLEMTGNPLSLFTS
ncbi:MAG: tocopherol cyclase family protein [Spirochaetota bacterium]